MPPLWKGKGRFPTLEAHPYLISMHQCFLFLSHTSDYKALCLLLAEKSFSLARVIPSLLIFQPSDFGAFEPSCWDISSTWLYDHGSLVANYLFLVDLDIPFGDKARKILVL